MGYLKDAYEDDEVELDEDGVRWGCSCIEPCLAGMVGKGKADPSAECG